MSEDFKIFLDDLVIYLGAQEAGIVQLQEQIKKLLGEARPSVKLPFDASRIKWQDRENEKGKYQLSEDFNSLDHKALLKFLNEHSGGCLNSKDSEGRMWFYWTYKNGSTIGRKLRKDAKAEVKR